MLVFLFSIYRLVPRLRALVFKIRFPEFVQDCKPSIVAVAAACEEIKKSSKLARVLEWILLIGNIMNTGSRLEQCVGFDISHLPKLSDTKDKYNHWTLLHFLVETVELEQPDLLHFHEDLIHLDRAAKASMETIDRILKHMKLSLQSIDNDMASLEGSRSSEDSFFDEMSLFSEGITSYVKVFLAIFHHFRSQ